MLVGVFLFAADEDLHLRMVPGCVQGLSDPAVAFVAFQEPVGACSVRAPVPSPKAPVPFLGVFVVGYFDIRRSFLLFFLELTSGLRGLWVLLAVLDVFCGLLFRLVHLASSNARTWSIEIAMTFLGWFFSVIRIRFLFL